MDSKFQFKQNVQKKSFLLSLSLPFQLDSIDPEQKVKSSVTCSLIRVVVNVC